MRELRISAAMSRPNGFAKLAPVVEGEVGSKRATLGLDFGTAFTKAVVGTSGRHYAVDWSDAVMGEDPHLLASVFSEASDGTCILGAYRATGWSVREGIKLQLLSLDGANREGRLEDAVIFVALAFRYVNGWLRRKSGLNPEDSLRWRLHLGLPTKSWNNDAITETFRTIAQAARVLACRRGPVTRTAARAAMAKADKVERPAVDVLPEFACQLYAYLRGTPNHDLHALVDIGAGTLDIAYFNVFVKDGESLLPIFASEVDRLGAHYLVAALSGAGSRARWKDGETSFSDNEVAKKLGCSASDVQRRRSLYLSSVAELFNSTTKSARDSYGSSPAFRRHAPVPVFLCGGGSRIPALRDRFDLIAKQAETTLGIKFQISDLTKPRGMVGKLESGFDRLSVAYGLSQIAANIGTVMRTAKLDPVVPKERFDEKHSDDDR